MNTAVSKEKTERYEILKASDTGKQRKQCRKREIMLNVKAKNAAENEGKYVYF